MTATIAQQWVSSPRYQSEKSLEDELNLLQQRVLQTARGQFRFQVTVSAREFLLLKATTEPHCGAHGLKSALERYIVYPLANLYATDHIHVGDFVRIDRHHNEDCLNFTREIKNLAPPTCRLKPEGLVGSVYTNAGKSVQALSL